MMVISDESETFEEIEMQNTVQLDQICVADVADLLHQQFAVITGGKSKEGCPLITFPDQNNFQTLSDSEYQRLMLYLTSVPSLQDTDLGFHLIIDRRKDRWNSVKTVLLKISVYFPGLIHVVYVLRPASFLQKALSEVSNKLFKDEFKFRMIVLSSEDELHEYVDVSQLTTDLGGTLVFSQTDWIQQRFALEKFSSKTQDVSNALAEFTKRISETEFPNNVDSTQHLLNQQTAEYSQLKEEILVAAKHGENLLGSIKEKSCNPLNHTPDTIGNVFAIERLLVQLEETERTFDEFWQGHSTKLRHCLDLRRFEQDFRELQINFDAHLNTVSEMTEFGDNVNRVDTLLRETVLFQKLCTVDIERGEEVISSGQQLLQIKNSCPLECVEPKCNELMRVRNILTNKLDVRIKCLIEWRNFIEQIDKANIWCKNGVELLTSQDLEKCTECLETSEKYLDDIQNFIATITSFNLSLNNATDFISNLPNKEAVLNQIVDKVNEVSQLCEKRIVELKQIIIKPREFPEIELPQQPTVGAPLPNRLSLRKAMSLSKMDSNTDDTAASEFHDNLPEFYEIHKVKQGHALAELLETERIYVSELASIIKGYKKEALSKDMQPLLPIGLGDKLDMIFGNIDEIYNFHSNVFLNDLENCISSIDLVALCFVQKRDLFYQLYSYYCQNIPRSEQLRETIADNNRFFQACQNKLGHKLPLAAYLLKPVQRITKYQLLLGDLLKYSDDVNSCKQLQGALDCMLVVLKCVNDSMLQISITGFPGDLSQQGDLLQQGLFSVWAENKKDLRLRIKPMQRHIFLYQKVMLFCKPATKTGHNKTNFQYKNFLKMSQIGLTESVKGDAKKFEVWLQGRQEVYTIQAATIDAKQVWVNEIKGVLFNQLEELKGEKIKQYNALGQKQLRQTTSWEMQQHVPNIVEGPPRTISCDVNTRTPNQDLDENIDSIEGGSWSSECSNSEDEEANQAIPSGRYVALADYCAVGNSEVSMREGDIVKLLKVGCAGWWFVKVIGTTMEGWAPAAYLENIHRKTSRCSSRSQDRLNDH